MQTPEVSSPPKWAELFSTHEMSPVGQFFFQRFLNERVATYEALSALSDEQARESEIPGQDPLLKEVFHQTKNTVMRAKVIMNLSPFDFSGYEDLQNPNYWQSHTRQEVLDLYLASTHVVFDLFKAKKENGQFLYDFTDTSPARDWFGKQVSLFELALTLYGHEARHNGIAGRELAAHGLGRPSQDVKNWG